MGLGGRVGDDWIPRNWALDPEPAIGGTPLAEWGECF